jgi:prophage regulatory protein
MNIEALSKDQHLITQQNLCRSLDMTRSGIAKLRLNDPTFPKPLKFGTSKQSTCYFVVDEVNAWLEAKLAERGAA